MKQAIDIAIRCKGCARESTNFVRMEAFASGPLLDEYETTDAGVFCSGDCLKVYLATRVLP